MGNCHLSHFKRIYQARFEDSGHFEPKETEHKGGIDGQRFTILFKPNDTDILIVIVLIPESVCITFWFLNQLYTYLIRFVSVC